MRGDRRSEQDVMYGGAGQLAQHGNEQRTDDAGVGQRRSALGRRRSSRGLDTDRRARLQVAAVAGSRGRYGEGSGGAALVGLTGNL